MVEKIETAGADLVSYRATPRLECKGSSVDFDEDAVAGTGLPSHGTGVYKCT